MSIRSNLHREIAGAHTQSPLLLVDVTASLEEVIRRMVESVYGAVLVCEDGRLVGIFTERDVLRVLGERHDLSRAISEFMSQPAVSVPADATLAEVIATMSRGGYRHLPVVDDQGRPTGVVDSVEVVHWLVEHFPQLVYTLPPEPKLRMNEREGP